MEDWLRTGITRSPHSSNLGPGWEEEVRPGECSHPGKKVQSKRGVDYPQIRRKKWRKRHRVARYMLRNNTRVLKG